ncbi:MAG: carboxypeptidase regulatory-like domain-containing protein [Bacteroidota bacterium]
MSRFGLLLFSFLLASAASAQVPITGTVTDAETGEPLPGANVALLDEAGAVTGGAATNADGRFALRAVLSARLAVRFIGYETARLTVEPGQSTDLTIALRPSSASLGEVVVVPGEDPAIALMRRVIARAEAQREAVGAYAVTTYGRNTVRDAEGAVVAVTESAGEAFWSPGEGWREVVVAERETPNVAGGRGAADVARRLVDLRSPDISAAGHRLLGPAHPNALSVYRFEITGTRALDGRRVVEIALEPRRRTASAFIGTLLILDATADVLAADLRPGPAFLYPAPLQIGGARYRQQFVPVAADSSLWLPADLRSEIGVGLALDGLLSADPITVERTVQLSDYRLGVTAPDSLRDGEATQRATEADASRLAEAGVGAPLTEGEAAAYAAGDSLRSLNEAWEFEGPLAGLVRRGLRDGDEAEPDTSRSFLGVSFSPVLRANPAVTVEAGLALSLRTGPLTITPKALYRAADGGVSLSADADLPLLRSGSFALAAEADVADDVARRAPTFSPGVVPGVDGRGGYYARQRVSAGLRAERGDLGTTRFSGILSVSNRAEGSVRFVAETAETFRPSAALDSDRLALGPDGQTVTVRSVQAEAAVGTLSSPLGALPRRALQVAAEVGEWDGAGTFWTAGGALDWRLGTFAQRRALAPALDVRLTGGIGGGEIPLTRLLSVEGTLAESGVGFSRFGALRTRTGVPYEGDAYGAAFWEHTFRSIPFEALGLGGLARRGYGVVLHGAHARTWTGDERQAELGRFGHALSATDGWHHEIGVGVTGLFGLLRADVTTRLDAPGTVVGVGVSRVF